MNTKLVGAVGLLILLFAPQTQAGLIYFSDRPTFDGAAGPLPIEDFEEANIGPGAVLGMSGDLDKNTNNAFFAPGDILDGLRIREDPARSPDGLAIAGAGVGGATKEVYANFFVDTLDLFFYNNDVNAVGMDLHSLYSSSNFTISIFGLGDALLGTTASFASTTGAFWGVTSSDIITRINLSSNSGQAEGVDNVAFGKVPEPSTLVLLGIGLLALARSTRRRS